ncbi:MAG: hypothetical protein JGK26_28450 [Microcoleus sp. PH2017_27_LUM_O_A]|nr:hypothetical protein [Microcoleus sp. PH2017_12_PCY_D_A]MCC3562969.1 hypothetical protein [Microcoleus sp. PH2017_27_LUM_O_A]
MEKSGCVRAHRLETNIQQGFTTVLGIRGSKVGPLGEGDRLLHSPGQVM